MSSTLFVQPEMVQAEVEARRERLTRDWQRHPRRARRARRLTFGFHLPVRRHA
jgi:hypothetical protein